jgi:hypothetical protein
MTLWSPDTCDCQIEISDEPSTRGQVVRHLKVCKVHADRAEDHNAVLAENRNKNIVCAEVEKAGLTLTDYIWIIGEDRKTEIHVLDARVDKQALAETLGSKSDRVRVV